MTQIVCDTGPLLHLREAGLLHLLQAAGRVLIPPAVFAELANAGALWQEKPDWVRLQDLESRSAFQAAQWLQANLLDPGEAEALALAVQIEADWFLTDDTAARLIAQQMGLEVHGSLGVVLWAAVTKYFEGDEAEEALEALGRSSLWISTKILDEAKAALRQIIEEPQTR